MGTLDNLEKISKIAVTSVATIAMTYFGVTTGLKNAKTAEINAETNVQALTIKTKESEISNLKACAKLVVNWKSLNFSRNNELVYADKLQKFCDFSLAKATKIAKKDEANAELIRETRSNQPNDNQQVTIEGFVALGKIDNQKYSQVNFDIVQSALLSIGAANVGDVLKARWGVNLRTNTELTTGGNNLIIGIVNDSDCVTIIEPPKQLRGQYWAKVELTACN